MKQVGIWLFVFLLFLASACLSAAQDKSMPYYEAGNKLYSQKNYDRAVQYYNAAIQFNPNLWQAFQGLGNCSYVKGDKAQALSNYQKCLSLHPDNPGLSSFVKSLRVEIENAQASSNEGYSPSEIRKIFRTASGISDQHFEICPSIGTAIEMGEYGDTGFGIGGGCFYMLDSEFGIGALTHLYLFGSSDITTSDYETQNRTLGNETMTTSESHTSLELVPAIKYKFDGDGIRPYLIGGLGVALITSTLSYSYVYQNGPPSLSNGIDTNSIYSGSGIFPILVGGGGLEFSLDHDMSLFAEVRADIIIGDRGSATYIPVESGLNFTL
jgi:hypothetical protein